MRPRMHKLKLVPNSPVYYEFIRTLRNDERVQPGFIQQVQITPEEQHAYMEKYGQYYHVCLCDSQPAGYVGVIDHDIRVATHPDYQKKGVGKFMVQEIMKFFPDAYAKIKVDNHASLKLFTSAGFKTKYYILEKEPEQE
jgi:GNAT superfamily N-acetyltransferase